MFDYEHYKEKYGTYNLDQLKNEKEVFEQALKKKGTELYENKDKPDYKIVLRAINDLIEEKN